MEAPRRPRLSIVVPVYGCAECLVELHRQLAEHLGPVAPDFELILVCDGSPDASWKAIEQLAAADRRVKGLDLSRNFGQHCAITAGIDVAEGDYMVVMDCDLQHRPSDVPRLFAKAQEGHDVVFARRVLRKDTWFKRVTSRAFVGVLGFLTDSRGDPAISNFSIVSRKVVLALRQIRERNRAYAYFVFWLGFQPAFIDSEHQERFAGTSSYSLSKLIGFAVESIVSSTDKPLRLSIRFGLLMALGSVLFTLWLAVRRIAWATPVEGWTSVMVSIFFVAGLLFANLGVLGLYVGRVFDETKRRPLYAVRERLNLPAPGEAPPLEASVPARVAARD